MGFLALITGIFKPLTRLIDDLHLSKEEKERFKIQMAAIKLEHERKALHYDSILLREKASIIRAEAQGQSWLQRNWRPILMLGFGFIVLSNYAIAPYARMVGLELPTLVLPPALLNLLTVGIGGYVVGRSAEKILKDRSANLLQGHTRSQSPTTAPNTTTSATTMTSATSARGDFLGEAPRPPNSFYPRRLRRRKKKS
ncbi:hypothetical protein COTS27_01047 [Spirochaetota bacterium]|nr:hypothetical protein COTS27_01047 [Spirochaetota bacterium]